MSYLVEKYSRNTFKYGEKLIFGIQCDIKSLTIFLKCNGSINEHLSIIGSS